MMAIEVDSLRLSLDIGVFGALEEAPVYGIAVEAPPATPEHAQTVPPPPVPR
jgi:hypothetical protein